MLNPRPPNPAPPPRAPNETKPNLQPSRQLRRKKQTDRRFVESRSKATPTHRQQHSMSRLYIGNLPMDMKEKDLEDIFYKYGKITDMQLKTPERPPAFGFVTFEDSRDADEAVRAR